MPAVTECEVENCAYNRDRACHALAITVGDTADVVVRHVQHLCDEHAHLLPHIETLRTTADTVGQTTPDALGAALADLQRFLADHLIVHAEIEERVLYPAVARVLGATEATATMSKDHVEIGRLARELGTPSETADGLSEERHLRRVLYDLPTGQGALRERRGDLPAAT
ncbi:hemerythrin domain-containing protein [Streptomyces sp. NBC_00631]|uniref:hemerythrin domain-containing protein n=1 Tax=Streptomyces sp. NBC_00631 TaxID=2975793 RepID=UPI0030E15444